jgi:hypothetical protein
MREDPDIESGALKARPGGAGADRCAPPCRRPRVLRDARARPRAVAAANSAVSLGVFGGRHYRSWDWLRPPTHYTAAEKLLLLRCPKLEKALSLPEVAPAGSGRGLGGPRLWIECRGLVLAAVWVMVFGETRCNEDSR